MYAARSTVLCDCYWCLEGAGPVRARAWEIHPDEFGFTVCLYHTALTTLLGTNEIVVDDTSDILKILRAFDENYSK